MTSKNSRTSSPLAVLPSDQNLHEEFKSCHNHSNHLLQYVSSPDDDSIFKSTHTRMPIENDGCNVLLNMRPTEREGDDEEFYSLHNNHNTKNE